MRKLLVILLCLAAVLSMAAGCAALEREKKTDPEEFFDDAAFIGDSISLKLQNYHAANGTFGKAVFLTAGSYSVNHAVNDTMRLMFRGEEMTPEDALAACNAKKVFILLGMNDIGLVGVEGTLENWSVMLQRIREKNPRIEIYIQSGTPIYAGGEKGKLTNENMDRYNALLKQFAKENDCHFVDVASALKDGTGALKPSFCSDEYVHLTDAGSEAWIEVLKKLAE